MKKAVVTALALVCVAGQFTAGAIQVVQAPKGAPLPCEQLDVKAPTGSGTQAAEQVFTDAEVLTWEIGTIVEIEDQLVPITSHP